MDNYVVAILIGTEWYLATPVPASAYGLTVSDGGSDKIWSEVRTTAMLCRVGGERASYVLPTPPDGQQTGGVVAQGGEG